MASPSPVKSEAPTARPSTPPVSWAWILQRFSGLLLLVFLAGHLWVEHFMNARVNVIASRLTHGIYDTLDMGLLIVVVYHGLNGLRGILKETLPGRAVWLDYTLSCLGIVTVVWGIDILWAFWYHRPFLIF